MRLRTGKSIGYDPEWLVYRFTMFDGNRRVDCQISNAALSALRDMRTNPGLTREGVFERHRRLIERVASNQYQGDAEPIRIFAKHLPSTKSRANRSAKRPTGLPLSGS